MTIFENHPLDTLNTFGLKASARFYAEARSEDECRALLQSVPTIHQRVIILGGGSNVILSGMLDALVIHPALRGITLQNEQDDVLIVEAMAGEVWHDFVRHCLQQGWYGLENLSYIPGTVGAAPVQNIGAYGVEITDVFESLTALDIHTGETRNFSHEECRFAYRDSIFKQEEMDRYLITRVRFRLSRQPVQRLDYGDIRNELAVQGIVHPTPLQLSDVIIAIRQRKLPDPAVVGNAGSFFKNPVISEHDFHVLKEKFPDVVAYPQKVGVKLAAGWLIDQSGWKGRALGPVGTYDKQALVLVNHGGACGADVLKTAKAIQSDVRARFGVDLEIEPRIYGD